jgi:hypothetical protein
MFLKANFHTESFEPGDTGNLAVFHKVAWGASGSILSQDSAVAVEDGIEGVFANVQCGQMRQKVVSHEERKEDEVINQSFTVQRTITDEGTGKGKKRGKDKEKEREKDKARGEVRAGREKRAGDKDKRGDEAAEANLPAQPQLRSSSKYSLRIERCSI